MPVKVTNKKKEESWAMAKKLYLEHRLSLDMALYGLKSSGHTKEEAAKWMKEVKREEIK